MPRTETKPTSVAKIDTGYSCNRLWLGPSCGEWEKQDSLKRVYEIAGDLATILTFCSPGLGFGKLIQQQLVESI